MNKNLTDEELFDYLMTSDYIEDMSSDDFRFLLHKWKYFFRIHYSRINGLVDKVSEKDKEIEVLKGIIEKLDKDVVLEKHKYECLKNKKLTWKERISGKIED